MRVSASTAMVAPPANAWIAAIEAGPTEPAAASAATVASTSSTPVAAQRSIPRRRAMPISVRRYGSAADGLRGVAHGDRHEEDEAAPVIETPRAMFSGTPSSTAPSRSAQPTDAAPSRVSIR